MQASWSGPRYYYNEVEIGEGVNGRVIAGAKSLGDLVVAPHVAPVRNVLTLTLDGVSKGLKALATRLIPYSKKPELSAAHAALIALGIPPLITSTWSLGPAFAPLNGGHSDIHGVQLGLLKVLIPSGKRERDLGNVGVGRVPFKDIAAFVSEDEVIGSLNPCTRCAREIRHSLVVG